MAVVFEETGSDFERSIPHDSEQGDSSIVCFRCGVCCAQYQAPLSFREVKLIAGALDLPLDVFLDRYVDEPRYGPEAFLLAHCDGACVFLERSEGSAVANCSMHPIKPSACKEWLPGSNQKECQKGLAQYWGLTLNPAGQLEGPEEKIRDFRAFLESLPP